jgi:hypothetical protein
MRPASTWPRPERTRAPQAPSAGAVAVARRRPADPAPRRRISLALGKIPVVQQPFRRHGGSDAARYLFSSWSWARRIRPRAAAARGDAPGGLPRPSATGGAPCFRRRNGAFLGNVQSGTGLVMAEPRLMMDSRRKNRPRGADSETAGQAAAAGRLLRHKAYFPRAAADYCRGKDLTGSARPCIMTSCIRNKRLHPGGRTVESNRFPYDAVRFLRRAVTEKQREYFDLITTTTSRWRRSPSRRALRQGVWDIIRRAETALRRVEEKRALCAALTSAAGRCRRSSGTSGPFRPLRRRGTRAGGARAVKAQETGGSSHGVREPVRKTERRFKKLRGKGPLTEADVKEAMREVRLAFWRRT